MTEPSNAVLAEQIRQLRKDFIEHKKTTRDDFRELEQEIESTSRITNELKINMKYVKDAVSEMKGMMTEFIGVVDKQNKSIDEFINSDKRMDHKRQLVVSVLQVASGIIIALIGFWASGKI